jgi:hypothetical protein
MFVLPSSINVLKAVQVPWGCLLFIFCDFCKPVISYPVYIASPCLPSDSGPFYILNLVDLADVFVTNSILQSIASDAS